MDVRKFESSDLFGDVFSRRTNSIYDQLDVYDGDTYQDMAARNIEQNQRYMQVYLMPSEHADSSWKSAGLAVLLVALVLASLLFLYYFVVHCCASKKPEPDVEQNSVDDPSSECNDRASDGCAPSEQPSKPAPTPAAAVASFRASPGLHVTQPYQPEPEVLARAQERMLAQLESTNQGWELGHGDFDTRPLQ